MFTGIIQKKAHVDRIEWEGGAGRLYLRITPWERPLQKGESIAVMGVCLSLVEYEGDLIRFDVLKETFDCTNLGRLAAGDPVNLERALIAGEPLGGHIVSGHVDDTGTVRTVTPVDRDKRIEIACGPELMEGLVYKGSITCDGISLTVAELFEDSFAVHIIPVTLKETSWGTLSEGMAVNLEIDLMGKYVEHYVKLGRYPEPVTWEALKKRGLMQG